MMTSSPLSMVATSALNNVCLPPEFTVICLWRIVNAIVALEFGGDRLPSAARCRRRQYIWSWPSADCLNCGVLDEVRRIEIGLTRRQANDIHALVPSGRSRGPTWQAWQKGRSGQARRTGGRSCRVKTFGKFVTASCGAGPKASLKVTQPVWPGLIRAHCCR